MTVFLLVLVVLGLMFLVVPWVDVVTRPVFRVLGRYWEWCEEIQERKGWWP